MINELIKHMEKLEPLSVKEQYICKKKKKSKTEKEFHKGFNQGVTEAFEEVENSVVLFKRYESDVKLLMKEQKPVWKNWVSYYEDQKIDQDEYLNRYNNWLFDFVFLKGKKEKEGSLFSI
jgi:hypothetical protein